MSIYENTEHNNPDTRQYEKWEEINNLSDMDFEKKCVYYNDCSICPMAIHQEIISTTSHHCVRGMSKRQFEVAMDSDCSF